MSIGRSHAVSRLLGITAFASFAVTAAALAVPKFPFTSDGHYKSGITVYPWWTWALILAGATAAALTVILSQRAEAASRAAAGIALVAAVQLAGTGFVARKHWRPAMGMGGVSEGGVHLELYQRVAVLMGVLSLVAAGAMVAQLWGRGAFERPSAGVQAAVTVLGLGVVGWLPFGLMTGENTNHPLHLWGALGLIYAGPWGGSLLLAAWLSRPAAVGIAAAVVGSVALAFLGPQMPDLLYGPPRGVFAVAAAAAVCAIALTLSRVAQPGGQLDVTNR
jgi:hypothetical protein